EQNNTLNKTFKFKNFSEAFAFMSRVALLAEKHDHHPWWSNSYNIVEIKLSTHDAANKVTDKDRNLAKEIDKLI
ncbi:MAG: 4a-hydroxytetrahydrobiopterin dehydratase, partial [Opitutaceae bacterium]|nr:4a-hydroxytetrahydrobiopterin dehydratase [Cytophagales bacterium]